MEYNPDSLKSFLERTLQNKTLSTVNITLIEAYRRNERVTRPEEREVIFIQRAHNNSAEAYRKFIELIDIFYGSYSFLSTNKEDDEIGIRPYKNTEDPSFILIVVWTLCRGEIRTNVEKV